MAKKSTQSTNVRSFVQKPKKKRAGVHAKSKTSNSKKSKGYRKKYKGQGR